MCTVVKTRCEGVAGGEVEERRWQRVNAEAAFREVSGEGEVRTVWASSLRC